MLPPFKCSSGSPLTHALRGLVTAEGQSRQEIPQGLPEEMAAFQWQMGSSLTMHTHWSALGFFRMKGTLEDKGSCDLYNGSFATV